MTLKNHFSLMKITMRLTYEKNGGYKRKVLRIVKMVSRSLSIVNAVDGTSKNLKKYSFH